MGTSLLGVLRTGAHAIDQGYRPINPGLPRGRSDAQILRLGFPKVVREVLQPGFRRGKAGFHLLDFAQRRQVRLTGRLGGSFARRDVVLPARFC
jgi:hypothetical protein